MAAPLSSSAAAAAAAAVAVATLLAALTGEVSAQRRGSRLASGAPSSSASNAAADFDCPEEFGYYPHPTDCTQYYVCVFGGALVESCTGGLMYSHELQTCDWPRNVGCGAGEGATVSTVRVTDPRTRQTTPSALPPSRAPVAISRGQQEQQRQQQEEIVKHQLYAEDVGPAEEVEIDRQQRVYRGQPSTLGQVQRDRDGLRHQPVNNVIPAPTGRASSGDKIAVISFGTQQQVQPAQYSSDLLTQDNYLTFETPQRRAKRQIHLRFPQQIAPQSQRLPFWSAPQPPPVGRLPPAQSFSSSPSESVSSSGFRPIPNPDVRNFQSLELRPPQESLQSTHNAKTFHPLSPHSLFTTPQTRVNVPSSNKAFQKGSSPVSTALTPSKYFVSFGNSSQATYAQNLPGIIYYTPLGDENYSFFNLGGSYFQSAPSASQQFNVQNQNHFPVNPPVHVNANSANRNGEQSNFKVLRPLTSMHELPYNENGKPLFRVADEPDTTRNADALTESSSKLSKMRQGASQIQISFPTASVQESIRHQAKVPATLEQHGITYYSEPSVTDGIRNYYEPNIYSHVPTKHHSPEERNTNGQIAQNHVRHKEIPSRVEYLQRKIPNTGSTLSAYDSHTEDSNAKLLRATATQQNKHHATQLSPEPRQRPNKSSGGNLYPDQNERDYDEDYVSEQDDENHFFQPPPDFFEDVNKFSHIENPFADINFDFDTYIEKLRGEVPNQKKLNETNTKNIKLNDSELENNGELETSEEGTAVEEEEVDITQKSTDSVSGNAEPSFNEETAKYSQPSVDKSKTETVPVATHKINRSRGRQRAYVQQDLHRKLPAVPLQQPAKQRGTVRNNHHVTQKTHVTEAPTSLRGKERHYKLAEEPTSPVYDKGKAVTAQQYNNYKGSQTYDHTTHKNIQRIPQTVKEHAQTSEDSFSTTSSRTHSASDKERPYTDYAAQEERYETTTAGYDNTYNHGSETTTIRTKSNKRKLPNRQNSDSLQGNYFQGGSHTSSEPTETEQKHHTTPDRKLLEQGQNFYTQNSEWQGVNEGKITAQHPVPIDTNAPGYINKEIPVKYVDTAALKVDFTESSDNDETIKATFKGNVVNYLPRNPNHTHISYTNISDIQENNKINVIGRQNRRHPVSLNLQSSSNRTSPTIYTDYPILTTDTTIPSAQLLQTTSKTHAVTRRPSANQLTRLRSRRPTSTSLPNDSLNNTDYSPTLPRPSLTVNPYSQRPSHKETAEQSRIIKRPKDSDSDIEETYNRPLPARSQLIKDEYGNENTIRVEPSNSYQPQPQSAVPTNPTIYNSSQQYDTAAQYDPYYNNYDEDVELYRDIDYGQYTGSQNNQQQPYRGNQNTYKTAPQPTAPQRTNSYVQPSYSSQDIYTQQQQPQQQQQQQQQQQDYSDSYNTQLSDEQYREPSRTPSRPQSRGRGENAATARASPSQNDKTEELDGSLNLSSLASDTPRSSSRPPTASTRQQQFQARGSNTESEGRRSPIRSTPRTSTSLEDTLSEDQKSPSRGQASSRRTSPVSDSPGVKSRFSETASLPVSRAVPQKQQTSSGRRAPVKYYESSDASQGSRSSAKNPELTSIEGFRQGSSENRRGPLLKSEASPDVEAVITPRSQKVVAESFQPARLISSMDDTQNDDDEIADPDFPSKSLSRNSIVQSEPSTTSRSRSRGSGSAKQAQCSDDVDSNKNTGCIEKQQVRVRPTTASPESQTTPTPSRTPTVNRNRGSSPYVSNSGTDTVNRGTPASVRTRPTLKPSTAFVSKAQEFVDIYKYPPSRPAPVYPQPQVDKTAAKCRKDVCLLPDCFCGGKDIPGDLRPEEVPQLVLLTFDDAVNDLNKNLYRDLFEKGRRNPNGCDIAATFYVSHEWTDYGQVQDLYAAGHEIATHSVSHSFGEQFSQKKWSKEIGGQREILAQYGGVRLEDVRGMRAPFLAIGGNKMFKMLYDLNFTYDSSMPVYENRPPSWPYTLDYKIFHDCMIPPCPTRSYPGVWEVPMVMWQDLNGGRCSMGDACSNPPTADGVYKMLIKNFERHYTTNRAPFGLFYHAAWFTQPHHKEGFEAFLDTIVAMDDVWLVTNWQAIQWVRQPTPLSEIKNFPPFQCNYADRPKKCNNPKVCNLWHKSGVRYMRTCQACPEVYPWTGKTGVKNSRIDNEIYEET
ncbi:uncharacterized protein LOC126274364 isoform X4 [Schistocerca gregaria]|uniref:uncharacterized protein LOC126274364 isoform X4 n=1 Tax=Schistocerca gregaria TaxID=7010 RepID=UPI00211E7455|nr:uncharacterized protein LOC126274364 isoform X4 [Schistocerca gregaria]